jgi:hypothetical protein
MAPGVALAALAGCALLAGCRNATQVAPEVIAVRAAALPSTPDDAAWASVPEHVAKLVPQDLVEPRLLTPSTPEIRVRAIGDGTKVAFRLEWVDDSKSDKPGQAQMVDACAVQLPQHTDKNPPAPQMGEEAKGVELTYWRADWQASVDGRGDSIRDLYPNASIDHYPADVLKKGSPEQQEMASRYSPARALGNLRAGPRTVPVEDLQAFGPGTLGPGPSRGSNGKGQHGNGGWAVVITRQLPESLAPGERTHVAFAVWQGSQNETGARKMRTGWVPLLAARGES